MDRATEIAHRIIPAAGSEWPLSEHGRAVLMSRAAAILRAEFDSEERERVKLRERITKLELALNRRAARDMGFRR